MSDWNPDVYPNLWALLGGDADAYGWFGGLPPEVRTALRGRNGVCTVAELQSTAADEREALF